MADDTKKNTKICSCPTCLAESTSVSIWAVAAKEVVRGEVIVASSVILTRRRFTYINICNIFYINHIKSDTKEIEYLHDR